MKATFTFTNKNEYLAYRANWKAQYATLSETIREKKWMHKEYSRACSKARIETEGKWPDYYNKIRAILAANPRYVHLEQKYKNDGRWLEQLRKQATEMLEELKAAKQEAQRQYLASKNQAPVQLAGCCIMATA